MNSITALYANPWARVALVTVYYLAILLGLVLLYGKGDFSTPPFVYQGF
jgi:integral membrane sensor domain MASE1